MNARTKTYFSRSAEVRIYSSSGSKLNSLTLVYGTSGGGGTFGVVMEATILTSPRVILQSIILTFKPNIEITREMWSILAENGLAWARDGWGGLSVANVVVMINPKLSKDEAKSSLSPLIQFGEMLKSKDIPGLQIILTEFSSWGTFFDAFTRDYVAVSLLLSRRD